VLSVVQTRALNSPRQKLRHGNIVSLMAVCTVGTPVYIVAELLSKGSLLEYLKSDEARELRIPNLVDMGAQVASGMVSDVINVPPIFL
jgi:fyn-related kinase